MNEWSPLRYVYSTCVRVRMCVYVIIFKCHYNFCTIKIMSMAHKRQIIYLRTGITSNLHQHHDALPVGLDAYKSGFMGHLTPGLRLDITDRVR